MVAVTAAELFAADDPVAVSEEFPVNLDVGAVEVIDSARVPGDDSKIGEVGGEVDEALVC